MINTIICLIIISTLILLGFMFYIFLSKNAKKGKNRIKWRIALYKILQVEFESEHDNNSTIKQ